MREVSALLPVTRDGGYVLRAARADDLSAVRTLCARAWPHGEDYVPGAWPGWLADSQGALLVVEHGQELAAVAKISFLAAHEGWLEGLRVDPAHRGQGLAGWILEVCLERAHALGATVARLGTGAGNAPVHKTAARQGMQRVASFRCYAAPAAAGAPEPCSLGPGDVAEARELLHDSPELAAAGGLYEAYWCWPELTDERLGAAMASGQALGVRGQVGRLAALALVQGARPAERAEGLAIGLLAGEPRAVSALAYGLRGLAARWGAQEVEAKLPAWPPLRAAAEAAGYVRDEEMEVWVYEKRWPLGPGA